MHPSCYAVFYHYNQQPQAHFTLSLCKKVNKSKIKVSNDIIFITKRSNMPRNIRTTSHSSSSTQQFDTMFTLATTHTHREADRQAVVRW